MKNQSREFIIKELREELVGPAPNGKEIDCGGNLSFPSFKDAAGPWKQKTGEEILEVDRPTSRYGVGVLYPLGTPRIDEREAENGPTVPEDVNDKPASDVMAGYEKLELELTPESEDNDVGVTAANASRPSSMGFSFLLKVDGDATLQVSGRGGRYRSKKVKIGAERTADWWLRSPVEITGVYSTEDILTRNRVLKGGNIQRTNLDGIQLDIEVVSRSYASEDNERLVTVCLVNRTQGGGRDETSVFQAELQVRIDGGGLVAPYPGPPIETLDDEEQSMMLLYRDSQTYAIGHGCAANWVEENGEVRILLGEVLPQVETPSMTPDIKDQDGSEIRIQMAPLAGLTGGDRGLGALEGVIAAYKKWLVTQRLRAKELDPKYHAASSRHLDECDRCLARMEQGLIFIQEDPLARRAFMLANEALLLQQIHGRTVAREPIIDKSRLDFEERYQRPDPLKASGGKGAWRPFQIAFLLTALRSSVDNKVPDRDEVDLIWFPTGGGKTEAYLGLAAFTMFYRRLRCSDDAGVSVLMRYTLRLLTAQQFERAATLICAMEVIRRREKLGQAEFSIGIWLGSSTTPNRREDARAALKRLERGETSEGNPFLIGKCPWCGAKMGPLKNQRIPKGVPRTLGYFLKGNQTAFRCPDTQGGCDFRSGLPIYVVDEDVYDERPSVVIATVDKFAMLAWRPEARKLFGLDMQGVRTCSPPSLIIQDELHLISGPLGSMVGLYESLIDELCTDRRTPTEPVRPKIVSSTATIRNYREQIRALFGRERASLFPPPELEQGNSFFARYAREESGELSPGRLYVGVHAPGLGSPLTAQVRTFSSLLQSPVAIPDGNERDPWWTLLIYFNSLRELGGALTLFQSDMPDYFKVLRARKGLDWSALRNFSTPMELTGRLNSDEVPRALAKLAVRCGGASKPVDVCLASNILEVGVDIDRLSLMAVVGQPKTTTSYIQATGRVGRRWWERPGLIITIYSPSRPRDRSHFESFRSFHQRLYAQVEPSSVTPFARPALDRALHAVLAAFVRQTGKEDDIQSPRPCPEDRVADAGQLLLDRVQCVDRQDTEALRKVLEQRIREWMQWERLDWESSNFDGDAPLLVPAGSHRPESWTTRTWLTPTSLRNVDAQCEAQITQKYLEGQNG
jgi:hypothetical protein